MTVSASTQTQQTQAIYKTIATKTTSAYENIAPTQKTEMFILLSLKLTLRLMRICKQRKSMKLILTISLVLIF